MTYKLTEALGGGECEIAEQQVPTGAWPNHVVVKVPDEQVGAWYVLVPRDALTEVKPPEPTELGWYLATIGETTQIVRKVEAEGWSVGSNGGFLSTWKTLNEDFPGITMVRLIPAPEPVTLPWKGADHDGRSIDVQRTEGHLEERHPGLGVFVATSFHGGFIRPDQAREMARALWTAADEAEATDGR